MSSNFPQYPTSAPPMAVPEVPRRPGVVTAAFWCFMGVAALELVVTILSVVVVAASGSIIGGVLRNHPELSGRHIDVSTLVGVGTVFVVVIGVIAVALYIVFPILLVRGHGWARIVLLVVTAISLLGITGDYGISAVKVILAIVATVLAFLTPASHWFRATKQARQYRRFAR